VTSGFLTRYVAPGPRKPTTVTSPSGDRPSNPTDCEANKHVSGTGTPIVAEGITNPPIDELLTKTDSKYRLVLYAAKRARQINAYYSQLGEGLLEYVGPLVDTHVQEKPLSIALRELNEDLLTYEELDPEASESTE
jgi:DNA-directed RNA polymerase subunit omega